LPNNQHLAIISQYETNKKGKNCMTKMFTKRDIINVLQDLQSVYESLGSWRFGKDFDTIYYGIEKAFDQITKRNNCTFSWIGKQGQFCISPIGSTVKTYSQKTPIGRVSSFKRGFTAVALEYRAFTDEMTADVMLAFKDVEEMLSTPERPKTKVKDFDTNIRKVKAAIAKLS